VLILNYKRNKKYAVGTFHIRKADWKNISICSKKTKNGFFLRIILRICNNDKVKNGYFAAAALGKGSLIVNK